MASLADTIRSGYSTGRDIGDDISRIRSSRAEDRIRQKYEALAAEEDQPLRNYLPQMEEELRQSGRGVFGSDRRGVLDSGLRPMSEGAIGRLHGDVLRAGERRAGALAMSGEQEAARGERASTLYGLGRFDDGQAQQIASSTIGATSKAVNGRGEYDPAAGALAMSGVSARYGDQAGAERNATAGNSFRMQAANAISGNLATMFQNPGAYTANQIRGTYEGLRGKVPDLLAHTELQVGDDGVWNIYANGSKTATGSFDPQKKEDQAEFLNLLDSFSRDPSGVVSSYQQARLKSIADEKERDRGVEDKFLDARIKATEALTKDVGIPGELASKLVGSASSSSGSGGNGWQIQEIGDDLNTFMVKTGGGVYRVRVNEPGEDPIQVFEADGRTPAAASVLNSSERREITQVASGLAAELAKGNMRAKIEAVNAQLNALGAMESQYRGRSAVAPSGARRGGGALSVGERNNNTGNIRDIGQFRDTPGYRGTDDKGFAMFDNESQGVAAAQRQLALYMSGKSQNVDGPIRTIAEIVPTWAPEGEENTPEQVSNYVAYVARRLGIDPTAELSEADIPRLAQAMSEFETGRRSSGMLPAERATAATAAKQAAPAAPAATTPEARAPQQLARISPEYLSGAAEDAQKLSADYTAKKQAYERFVADNGPGETVPVSLGGGALAMGSGGTYSSRANYRDPAVQRVHDQLKSRMEAAEQKAYAAAEELKANTKAVRQQGERTRETKRAAELASKYDPGVADIIRRL